MEVFMIAWFSMLVGFILGMVANSMLTVNRYTDTYIDEDKHGA